MTRTNPPDPWPIQTPGRPEATGRKTPEGPYEGEGVQPPHASTNAEMLQIIDLVAGLRAEGRRSLPLGADLRDLGIILHLVRDHLVGRLTTRSSLAAGSGLSYGTAFRAIDGLIESGAIVRRERTATGKSYSLHPSSDLLRRWQEFARVARLLVGTADPARPAPAKRSKSAPAAAVIPPPAALETKLALPRGLRVLVHADPTFMAMNALKRQLEMILGVDIRSRALSIDRLREEIVLNGARATSAYDVVACDMPWFGDMVAKDRLLPLDPLIAASGMDMSDFIPDAVASARRRNRQYGIPVLTTAELLVYRTDLLAEAGLEPPRTTAEALAAARALHAPRRGRFGIAWNGARGTALGHTFMVIMAAHGQPIVDLRRTPDGFAAEDRDGDAIRPMFDTLAARATAEYLQELLAVSPPEILTMTWYDRARAYAGGRTAMAYAHTLLANLFERDAASAAYGRTGYLPHPTGLGGVPISPLGGYALVIPRNIAPDRIPAAWKAVETLTSAAAAKLYMANGSLASPRFSVSRDPEVAALSPLIAVVDDIARRGILRAWPRPPVPGISGVIAIAGEEIHDMLRGRKTLAAALADAQNRAATVMRDALGRR
jgi:multiple sugar transport system substrate-binding protein